MEITLQILQESINQNQLAQKSLYEFCYKQFIKTCMRYHNNHEDARFALNKAYMKILKGLETVDWESLNFPAWSKRIIVNSLIDDYRQKKNQQSMFVHKEHDSELENVGNSVKNEAEIQMSYKEILDLLKTIPSISAQVFTLYAIDGYSHKEIAEMMDFTEGNSKWHLSRARQLLRDRIERVEENENVSFKL